MQDGATLALIAKPAVFAIAPGTSPVNEVEDGGAVFLVQLLHFGQASLCHFFIPGHAFVGTCGGITDEGVEDVLWATLQTLAFARTVDIGEVIDLQLFQQLDGPCLVLQNGRHDDHGSVFLGNQAVLELDLESVDGLVNLIEQLVEQIDDNLAHRHPHDNGQQYGEPTEALP